MALRFDENNAYAQCKRCNIFLGGNWDVYLEKMIEKRGQSGIDKMMKKRYITMQYSIINLNEIEKKYTAMAEELDC